LKLRNLANRKLTLFALAGMLVLAVARCSYIALPGGIVVNFPGFSGDAVEANALAKRVRLPDGFTISTYAAEVPNARMLHFTPSGDLLVSQPRQGKVLLLERDRDGDGRPDGKRVLLEGLDLPHGLDEKDGWLYVAEGGAIARVRFDPETGTTQGTVERIVKGLPTGGNHWTRTVHVGPDDRLYVSVGSSCNVCEEDDPRRAAIVRYQIDGTGEELYATGLRNSVDFAWRPGTDELYATDNGRDLLGDDFPPCELNRVVQGGFYGWPYANGDRIADPDFGEGNESKVARSLPPAHGFAAHTAPLGVEFYDASAFPERYRGAAFVALHGSWNRRHKIGYEVAAVFFQDGAIRAEPFAHGFEVEDNVIGRPVDVAVGPDGALYVSDDYAGTVYRIAYGESPAAARATRPKAAASDPLADLAPEERRAASASGEKLWDESDCARCHVRGEAGAKPRPLAGLVTKYDVDSLAAFLAAPQPPMPLYDLDEAQRRDLAVFLLERWGK
jgi:glucose/arabinose dehydrogenase